MAALEDDRPGQRWLRALWGGGVTGLKTVPPMDPDYVYFLKIVLILLFYTNGHLVGQHGLKKKHPYF